MGHSRQNPGRRRLLRPRRREGNIPLIPLSSSSDPTQQISVSLWIGRLEWSDSAEIALIYPSIRPSISFALDYLADDCLLTPSVRVPSPAEHTFRAGMAAGSEDKPNFGERGALFSARPSPPPPPTPKQRPPPTSFFTLTPESERAIGLPRRRRELPRSFALMVSVMGGGGGGRYFGRSRVRAVGLCGRCGRAASALALPTQISYLSRMQSSRVDKWKTYTQ